MALLLLLLAVCGGDDSSSSSSSSGDCTKPVSDVVPDYPACRSCEAEVCAEGSACGVEGFYPIYSSSVCLPKCAADGRCPKLGDLEPVCEEDGWCRPRCTFQEDCPQGYVCGTTTKFCQVRLE